ncbi:MAG TPA: phosphatase PAP2 family protein [Candidatus Eisenbacteria bacterium]|jgi:membrane-associated phospholipid phosphatase|nr:phosphatase PAP2 family protein [Candidatus Eisenbacteria bacterium]
MERIRKWLSAHERSVLFSAIVTLFAVCYFGTAALPPWRPREILTWDPVWLVPYVPVFIVPYISVFVMPLVPVVLVRDRMRFRRAVEAFAAAIVASGLVFLAVPLAPPHPPDVGTGFFAGLTGVFYALDVPTNLFPSLHVSSAFLTAFIIGRERPSWRYAMLAWAALIAVSTLFVRQHYAVDVAGGIVLAFLCRPLLARPVR